MPGDVREEMVGIGVDLPGQLDLAGQLIGSGIHLGFRRDDGKQIDDEADENHRDQHKYYCADVGSLGPFGFENGHRFMIPPNDTMIWITITTRYMARKHPSRHMDSRFTRFGTFWASALSS